jgi:hypothetical protein
MATDLRAEIEGIIEQTMFCADNLECRGVFEAACLIVELLRKQGDSTWYCERFGSADYDPNICARYKHEGCGPRLIVDAGVSDAR